MTLDFSAELHQRGEEVFTNKYKFYSWIKKRTGKEHISSLKVDEKKRLLKELRQKPCTLDIFI